jgi:hypothetical protein
MMTIARTEAIPPRTILCSIARRLMLVSNLLLRSTLSDVCQMKEKKAAAGSSHQDQNSFLGLHSSIEVGIRVEPEGHS